MTATPNNIKIDLGGLPLLLLFITFFTMKVMGYITWSWLWVTCPLWAPIAILLVGLIGVVICSMFFGLFKIAASAFSRKN